MDASFSVLINSTVFDKTKYVAAVTNFLENELVVHGFDAQEALIFNPILFNCREWACHVIQDTPDANYFYGPDLSGCYAATASPSDRQGPVCYNVWVEYLDSII